MSSQLILLVFALICTVPSWGTGQQVSDANAACHGVTSGTIPHPTDCTRYYVCWQSTGVAGQCSPNFVFNPRVLFCVHQSQYHCPTDAATTTTTLPPPEVTTTTTPEPPCVQSPWTTQFCATNRAYSLVRNPFNCTQYIDCDGTPQANNDCPPGKIFSVSYQDCFPGNRESCEMAPLGVDFCDGRPTGSYAHPYQCNRFVTCVRGAPRLESCPPEYVFDEERLRCVRGDVVQCSSLLNGN